MNTSQNFRCTTPRRESYDDPFRVALDLRGHWMLATPGGRSCEIVLYGDFGQLVDLHWACLDAAKEFLGVRKYRISGEAVELTDESGTALWTFSTTDLDNLRGEGSSTGYRLVRLEAVGAPFRYGEGAWNLYGAGLRQWNPCVLFLRMERRAIENVGSVYVPRDVSMSSRCREPVAPEEQAPDAPAHSALPDWVSWDVKGLSILLRERNGIVTVFRPDWEQGSTGEVRMSDGRVYLLRLKKAR